MSHYPNYPGMDHSQAYYAQGGFDQPRGLYVGNLDPKVNDALLWEVFSTVGHVENCKIIKDKFGESAGYGFVDYYTRPEAELALQALNGKRIYGKEVKVNWASHSTKDDSSNGSNHHNIFVGDLSSEIKDDTLYKAFENFGSISDARVMWDQTTGRSRGYGFVAFREKADAERAMEQMNGVWLGNRAIRCNWANQKSGGTTSNTNFEDIAGQTTTTNTTVYVGNLHPDAIEQNLGETFQNYGTIEEIRIQKGKGYGFVKFQTHEQATRAIVVANETPILGRPIKCSWGKERGGSGSSTQSTSTQNQQMYGYYPQYGQNYMYNMPYYGQQGYYQGDPNYYAQGYDPYAAYAGYYQQQPPPE